MSKAKQNHPRPSKAIKPTKAIKHPRSFKLSDTALDILAELAIAKGIAKSAVIENLLREEKARGVKSI